MVVVHYGRDLVHLLEWTFDQKLFKRISTNLNSSPNPKAQKPFREKEMTSFFGQVSRYHYGRVRLHFIILILKVIKFE